MLFAIVVVVQLVRIDIRLGRCVEAICDMDCRHASALSEIKTHTRAVLRHLDEEEMRDIEARFGRAPHPIPNRDYIAGLAPDVAARFPGLPL